MEKILRRWNLGYSPLGYFFKPPALQVVVYSSGDRYLSGTRLASKRDVMSVVIDFSRDFRAVGTERDAYVPYLRHGWSSFCDSLPMFRPDGTLGG